MTSEAHNGERLEEKNRLPGKWLYTKHLKKKVPKKRYILFH